MIGVDALNEFSVVLLVRIRTLSLKQYAVGRAFNRMVKIAFHQHRVAMRDPPPVAIISPPAEPAQRPDEAATPALRRA
jgi:hypothetical protein